MTTDMFTEERLAVADATDTAEEAAISYEWIEDTLKEAPDGLDLTVADGAAPLVSLPPEDPSVAVVEDSETAPVIVEVAPYTGPTGVAICSQTNGRANNEDSYYVQALPTAPGTTAPLLFALSDGMGGHDFGEHASRETLRKLALLLFEQHSVLPHLNGSAAVPTAEQIGKTMVQAVPLVSAHVQRIAEMNGWNRSGATLVAGVVAGDTAVFINVGDSPAFHVEWGAQKITPLTDDHSLAGMLLKANLITPDMARVHEGRSQLEHYIGGPNLPHDMPIRTVLLAPGDYLLLCSDGVSNSLAADTILRLLVQGQESLSDCAAGFVVHARKSGEQDNQTVVLYRHGSGSGPMEVVIIPDAGPVAANPADFADNVPATTPFGEDQT